MTTVDTATDRRIWDSTDTAIYVRIPEGGYPSGRTVAYALLRRPTSEPARWEVRKVLEEQPIATCQRRETAVERLDDLTEGWR